MLGSLGNTQELGTENNIFRYIFGNFDGSNYKKAKLVYTAKILLSD